MFSTYRGDNWSNFVDVLREVFVSHSWTYERVGGYKYKYREDCPHQVQSQSDKMLSVVTCVLLVAAASAAPLNGPCPDPKTVTTFNATKFSGLWFDAAHTQRNTGLQLSCDQVKFTSTVPTKMSFVSASFSSATKNTIMVAGDVDIQNYSGVLSVSMAGFNKSEVRVLATDYQTYAVLWSCQNNTGTHTERTLILTRDKHPSSNVLTTAKKSLENNNISKSTLHESTQHKCPEYNFNDVSKPNSTLGYGTSMGSLLTATN